MNILQFILQEKQIKGLIDAQNKAKHILSFFLCLSLFSVVDPLHTLFLNHRLL